MLLVPIHITTCNNIDTQMIDSGAEGKFIDQNYAWSIGMNNIWLKELILVFNVNVNGTNEEQSLTTQN